MSPSGGVARCERSDGPREKHSPRGIIAGSACTKAAFDESAQSTSGHTALGEADPTPVPHAGLLLWPSAIRRHGLPAGAAMLVMSLAGFWIGTWRDAGAERQPRCGSGVAPRPAGQAAV